MASPEHLDILKEGVTVWNAWRAENPEVQPDLSKVYLRGAYLSGANLTTANLTGANLTGAHLTDALLFKADLTGANLTGATLFGAHLTGIDLSKADLSGARLAGADLTGANLTRANLTTANLTGADLTGAHLTDALLFKADLTGAILRRVDLTGADLTGANLTGANLTRANLTGANLTGADLRQTMLADEVGDSINLTKAVLTGAHLTPKEEGSVARGFLELATATGLDTVDFGDSTILPTYLVDAFDYIHEPYRLKAYPHFIEKALQNIKLLRALMVQQDDPPPVLVEVVQTITAELINYLKAHPKELYQLKPRQFEELIAEILASYGWEVKLTPASKDGGYDLYAISPTQATGIETSWIIECKKYREDRKIGVDIVRGLFGVKLDLKVANAMLATTSHFTKGVHDYKASRYDLELRDYEGILEWINEYRPNPNGRLYVKDNQLILPGEK